MFNFGNSRELVIVVKAIDEASKTIEKVADKGTTTFSKFGLAISGAFTAVGSAIAGFAIKSLKDFSELGGELQRLVLTTGFTTEGLSLIKYVAGSLGIDLGNLSMAIMYMRDNLRDNRKELESWYFGGKKFDVNAILKLPTEEQFFTILKYLRQIKDEAQRQEFGEKVFGLRTMKMIMPLVMLPEKDWLEAEKNVREMGIEVTEEQYRKMTELNKSIYDVKSAFEGLKIATAEGLAPQIIALANWIEGFIIKYRIEAIEKGEPWATLIEQGTKGELPIQTFLKEIPSAIKDIFSGKFPSFEQLVPSVQIIEKMAPIKETRTEQKIDININASPTDKLTRTIGEILTNWFRKNKP